MGDPIIEDFFTFLCDAVTNVTLIAEFQGTVSFPSNTCDFNTRYSELWKDVPMWY